jgi:hypothetical protein
MWIVIEVPSIVKYSIDLGTLMNLIFSLTAAGPGSGGDHLPAIF